MWLFSKLDTRNKKAVNYDIIKIGFTLLDQFNMFINELTNFILNNDANNSNDIGSASDNDANKANGIGIGIASEFLVLYFIIMVMM